MILWPCFFVKSCRFPQVKGTHSVGDNVLLVLCTLKLYPLKVEVWTSAENLRKTYLKRLTPSVDEILLSTYPNPLQRTVLKAAS